jgi:hypothetical protein
VYRDMNRVTLAVVAVLLAVPAVAQAKAGIEFDQNIEAQQPGDRQNFSVFVHGSNGGPPMASFRNTRTGEVIDVRTVRTNGEGNARGSVIFPNRGPWTATLLVGSRPVTELIHGSAFELAPAAPKPAATPPPPPPSDDSGFPLWLLTLPAAGLAALGIWLTRRRPRELGT